MCLLDSSLHHRALSTIEGGERRGRPDIAHLCLLLALDSLPSRRGKLRTYLHTRNNMVIELDPSVRLPRNCNRFAGLMEQALLNGSISADGRQLISVHKEELSHLLHRLGGSTYVLDDSGKRFTSIEMLRGSNIVIGGFPHGSYLSALPPDAPRISISDETLMAWTAAAIVLTGITGPEDYFLRA